jgi:hypothetical protein
MEEQFRQIIESVGEDPNREGLVDTPDRAARAFGFLTKGYKENPADVIGSAIFETDTDEMVIVKNIEFIPCANTTCYRSSASVTSATCRKEKCSASRKLRGSLMYSHDACRSRRF